MRFTREYHIPKGSTKVSDKHSDAVAYVSQFHSSRTGNMRYCAAVFFGKQSKPVSNYTYSTEAKRAEDVARLFKARQDTIARVGGRKEERKEKSIAFAASIEIGDIFHYSFGYDETHHVFYEVTDIKGRFATVRRVKQAAIDLGYDNRHRCMPQSGDYCGEPTRVLIQDGLIKVDRHYHASKWNTKRVAGVPVGPAYTGGGMH